MCISGYNKGWVICGAPAAFLGCGMQVSTTKASSQDHMISSSSTMMVKLLHSLSLWSEQLKEASTFANGLYCCTYQCHNDIYIRPHHAWQAAVVAAALLVRWKEERTASTGKTSSITSRPHQVERSIHQWSTPEAHPFSDSKRC